MNLKRIGNILHNKSFNVKWKFYEKFVKQNGAIPMTLKIGFKTFWYSGTFESAEHDTTYEYISNKTKYVVGFDNKYYTDNIYVDIYYEGEMIYHDRYGSPSRRLKECFY